MSVVLETTLGDITIDLFLKERPRASLNFLKLCKMKYFNYNLFHTISRGFIAQTGDPTGSRNGGESIFGVMEGPLKRYFEAETNPRIKHTTMGLVSFVGTNDRMIGSQFFITLGTDLTYLDEQHCVFGEVMEGLDVLELLSETICDQDNRPYQDVRITHTVVLEDPFPDPERLRIPSRSPSPSAERLQGGRIAPDEEIDETQGKSMDEVNEIIAAKEAKARATILEMIGDIPDADMAPPENVLFVCKLNPVTTDDDLEIIFSRFGKIKSCEVIRDKKTAESLQYAFVEFEDRKACEEAYFKMDNVLIDDRRIHVDFSQSVAKVQWHGKGRGVTTYDDRGKKSRDKQNDLGNGRYKNVSNSQKWQTDTNVSDKYSKNEKSIQRKYEYKDSSRDYDRQKQYETRKEDNYRYKTGYRDNYQKRDRSRERGSKEEYSNEKYYNKSSKYEKQPSTSYKKEGTKNGDRKYEKQPSTSYKKEGTKNGDRKYRKSRSRSLSIEKSRRPQSKDKYRSHRRSRSLSREESRSADNKGKYIEYEKSRKSTEEKYSNRKAIEKKTSKSKSKEVKKKKSKHKSSSDSDSSSSEDETSSSEEEVKRKSKHKRKDKKRRSSSTDEEIRRKHKKKKKNKKRKYSSSSDDS